MRGNAIAKKDTMEIIKNVLNATKVLAQCSTVWIVDKMEENAISVLVIAFY